VSTPLSGGSVGTPVRGHRVSVPLRLDPIACTGHGLCAELFPERISLDDWGYPVIEAGELTPQLAEHARRAVACCPALALRLRRDR
jgi:ferredoxin